MKKETGGCMKKIGTVFMATLLILDGMFGETNIQAATFEQLEQKEEQNRVYSMETVDDTVESTSSPMATAETVESTSSPMAIEVTTGSSVSTEKPGENVPTDPDGEKGDGTDKPGRTELPSCMVTPAVSSRPSATRMPTPESTAEATKEPIVSSEPTQKVPQETESPVATMAPNITKMPINTQGPIITKVPEKTMKPGPETASPTMKPIGTNITTGSGVTATSKPVDINAGEHTQTPTSTALPNPDNSSVDDVIYCSVHYKLNGGTNAAGNPSKVYATGASYCLQDPKKKGYSFEGWYLEGSFKHRVYYVEPNGASSVTYYAKWKIVTVAKAKIVSAKRLKNKKIRVKVGNCSGADGYEYVYSLTPTMAKKSLVRSVKNPKDLTKLKKKAKYYIKVRCYKYDSWGRKIYGSYSKVVKCK